MCRGTPGRREVAPRRRPDARRAPMLVLLRRRQRIQAANNVP